MDFEDKHTTTNRHISCFKLFLVLSGSVAAGLANLETAPEISGLVLKLNHNKDSSMLARAASSIGSLSWDFFKVTGVKPHRKWFSFKEAD
eukprot:866942-Amphidinium_carterae.1